ncbi:hypothetical protein SELMODRAFT_418407 [Selaginella moellendorffii]|uniref:Uncharacterized protein n=1 Tax=Selaginella moellendorffii TaxID=88036 RepID=D8S5L5_SELML|nr:hypothetical protein SELMODRAFT_418407 [Selaginella moellendorffii]
MTRILKWERLPAQRARAGHTATLVGGSRILVFGGRCGDQFMNDLWEFDLQREKWRQLQEHAPFAARAYHSATVVGKNTLWIIGGSDAKTIHDDVHALNTETLEWSTPVLKSQGTPRGTHAAVIHPLNPKCILVFGGYGGFKPGTFNWLGDLSVLNTGKNNSGIVEEDDLSVYDGFENKWFTIKPSGEGPCPRSNHAAVLAHETSIFVHGGRYGKSRLNDIYSLEIAASGASYKWQNYDSKVVDSKSRTLKIADAADGPEGRAAHCLVVCNDSLYMLGGYGGKGGTFSDMYVVRRLPQKGRQTKSKATSRKVSFVSLPLEGGEDNEGWFSTRKEALSASHTGVGIEADDPYHWTPEDTAERTVLLGETSMKPCSSTKRKSPPGFPQEDLAREVQNMRNKRLVLEGQVAAAQAGMTKASTELETVQAEKERLQRRVDALQDQVDTESTKASLLQRELEERVIASQRTEVLSTQLREELQASALKLDSKEREKQDLHYQLKSVEKKLDERESSLERIKELHEDAVLERDEYKSCVGTQLLCWYLRFYMTYASGKNFWLYPESCRAMQEHVTLLTKQLDQANEKLDRHHREKEELNRSNGALSAELQQVKAAKDGTESTLQLLRNELASARTLMERNALEVTKMKENADEAASHIATLHSSLRKAQEELRLKVADNDRLRNHLHELEEFEQSQVQLLQSHIERLQCLRQSCPRI